MPKNFNVFMVSIKWLSPSKIQSLKQGAKPLFPNKEESNEYEYDILTYQQEDNETYQFSIQSESQPFLNGSPMFCADTINKLWINKGDWIRDKGYHKCESINSSGELDIQIEEVKIKINISPSIEGFDFEALKSDFEANLWQLLTLKTSGVTIQKTEIAKGGKLKLPDIELFLQFAEICKVIINNPQKELKEINAFVPLGKVKPIVKTFMHIATKGMTTNLPSKKFVEHYDIYDNRYLVLMLNQMYKIIQNNILVIDKTLEAIIKEGKAIKSDIEKLENGESRKADKDKLSEEIEYLEKEYLEWEQEMNNLISEYGNKPNDKVLAKKINFKNWHKWQNNKLFYIDAILNDNILFEVDNRLKSLLENLDSFDIIFSYEDKGIYKNKYSHFYISGLEKVSRQNNSLQIKKEKYKKLEENNWDLCAILSPNEKDKAEKEQQRLIDEQKKKRKKRLELWTQLKEIKTKYINTASIFKKLLSSDFVKSIKHIEGLSFKASMTYLQNPKYKNAHVIYKQIWSLFQIDLDDFGVFEKITNYGIRELPQLYELWCLISIIKVLENDFHFSVDKKDVKELVKMINPDNKNPQDKIAFKFQNDLEGREVTLYYQQTLRNNKRPDFLVHIIIDKDKPSKRVFNLILDAKYKNYEDIKKRKNYNPAFYEIKDILEKYTGKSAVTKDTYVFVLHPCKNDSFNNMGGEQLSKYGKDDFFKQFINHKYGFCSIEPYSLENLKKIFNLSFQYLAEKDNVIEKKTDGRTDPEVMHNIYCGSCGGIDLTEEKLPIGITGYRYDYLCNDTACGHKTSINYCWNCKTRLFKHGGILDFHIPSPWYVFDIQCPNCGMTVGDYK